MGHSPGQPSRLAGSEAKPGLGLHAAERAGIERLCDRLVSVTVHTMLLWAKKTELQAGSLFVVINEKVFGEPVLKEIYAYMPQMRYTAEYGAIIENET